MEKLLIPTDFSPAANNAGRYALHLARGLKAGLLLCNAMLIPIEAPGAAQVAWPLEDYNAIKQGTVDQLKREAEKLAHKEEGHAEFFPGDFEPEIAYTSEVGAVTEVLRNVVDEHNVSMVVMGLSGAGSVEKFFTGSNTRAVINRATYPALLVPPGYTFRPLRRIAFATNLDKGDIAVLQLLAGLARAFDAEIDLCHITDSKYEEGKDRHLADLFMDEVHARVDYDKIHYRHIKSIDVDHGLDWLYEHSLTDLLVMVHHPHSFFSSLFTGSHTQQLARHITLPLLVYPAGSGHQQ